MNQAASNGWREEAILYLRKHIVQQAESVFLLRALLRNSREEGPEAAMEKGEKHVERARSSIEEAERLITRLTEEKTPECKKPK